MRPRAVRVAAGQPVDVEVGVVGEVAHGVADAGVTHSRIRQRCPVEAVDQARWPVNQAREPANQAREAEEGIHLSREGIEGVIQAWEEVEGVHQAREEVEGVH